jgi:TPR repeat protein
MKLPESQTALVVAQSTALVRKAAAKLAKRGLGELWLLESAEEWFERAKTAKSQNQLIEFFECLQRTVALDPEHTDGLDQLGMAYHDGIGTLRDQVAAVEYFRRAAERGHAQAQCHLGLVYDLGHGVARNKVEGLEWERKAAEQGYAPAVWRLADRYAWGKGVPRSRFQAEAWYRKAAEKGHAPSQFELAKMYLNDAIQEQAKIFIDDPSKMYQGKRHWSVGVFDKTAEAESWGRKAANQGLEEAKEWLARYYSS